MLPLFRFICLSALLLSVTVKAMGAVVLSVDINDALDNPNDTAPGFADYVLADNTLTVGTYTVDVSPAGGAALDDVHRVTPATGGALTLGALYRDCIFAAGDNTANFYRVGIDAVLTGLTPGKRYTLTVWSYDSGSAGTRTSDWSVIGLGGPAFGINNYAFNGSVSPSSDSANRFTISALADASGQLTLRGRPASQSATNQVFLNGFTVDELAPAPVQADAVLALDFNQRLNTGAANTQSGFQEFLLTGATSPNPISAAVTRTYGAYAATLTPIGGTMDDRNRATPGNSGAFMDSLLVRDFVFATSGATGLDLRIQGLTPNHTYLLELWSFDTGSPTTVRTSDWTVNGAPLWDDYGFNGANTPATNNDCKMAGVFTTNASGELLISGRVVANAPAVFLDAVRVSDLLPAQIVDFAHPILSEFLADNGNSIVDEDGDTSDWIEIWNTTAGTLDLAGWRLTDDPGLSAKWVFPPDVVLSSQGRLIVWASGKNRTTNPAALHTNFALNKSAGSNLALARPDGTIVTTFSNLPSQRENVSYGLEGSTEPLTEGFFLTPTPGAANSETVPGFVADTVFDFTRGFYSAPFAVHITCATPGASIYFTIDGSEPTTSSAPYPGPAGIPISTTTVVRARAFALPLAPTNIDTQTYIFNAHVQNQPANPPGWPATWGTNSEVAANTGGDGTVPADYAMDSRVVNNTLPGYGITDALTALPALALTLDPAGFHSVGSGIYANPQSIGSAWERAASIEWLNGDGSGFHTNAGVSIHGNSSRRPWRMQKHSFRLYFRSQYGDGRLNEKLFEDTTVQSFNRLVLHCFFTDGWGLVSWDPARYRPNDSVYFRDPWMRKSFAAMGHDAVSGRYAHVYVNGLYWGIYDVSERIDDDFCADHFGGLPTDWDVMADFTIAADGNATAWNSLFTFLNSADLTQQANYQTVLNQVDMVNFVDYYLLHVHGDSEDWPHHNGYAVRNRNFPGAKWRFLTWDQEIIMDPTQSVDRLSTGATNTGTDRTAGRLYQRLKVNPEFRLLFADRAHRHLHDNGALSTAAEQARWQAFVDILDKPIVAESARWGDTADATPYGNAVPAGTVFKRETHWLPSIATVRDSHFANLHNPANANSTIAKLRANSLYPNTEPPAFSQHGGNVPNNYALSITAPAGNIYYTLDGSDPRQAFTGTAVGTLYSGPVTLAQTGSVKARARNGAEWSALTEAQFIVGVAASAANLTVSELNYHPQFSEDHEFIELVNKSAQTIDLTGVHFTAGISFAFADATLLAAGARILVVRNLAAFTSQYGGGLPVAGEYVGALDNSGEEIALAAAHGSDIFRFTYDDMTPWPVAPDGSGRTLVLRSPNDDPNNAANWQTSLTDGGSPGTSDSVAFAGVADADLDRDGLVALVEHAIGSSDTELSVDAHPVLSVENFDSGTGPQPHLTLTARHNLAADDTRLSAEIATNMGTWSSAPGAVVFLGETILGDGSAVLKWRAATPLSAAVQQYFRLRATLAP